MPRRCLKATVGICNMVSLCSFGRCLSSRMSFVALCCTFSRLTFLIFQGWPPHSVTIFKMRPDHCFVQFGHVSTVNMFNCIAFVNHVPLQYKINIIIITMMVHKQVLPRVVNQNVM